MSLIDLGTHIAANNCLYCLGGMSPAGFHPELGPVLSLCPTHQWCEECDDESVFSTDYETHDHRINTLLADGLVAISCGSCNGIVAVIPATNGGGIR